MLASITDVSEQAGRDALSVPMHVLLAVGVSVAPVPLLGPIRIDLEKTSLCTPGKTCVLRRGCREGDALTSTD